MAKTLVDIDPDLLAEVQRLLGTKTKTATVNQALRKIMDEAAFNQFLDHAASLDDEQVEVLMDVRDTAW